MMMDWHTQLITLYLEVCKHWQEVGWTQAQRHAPFAEKEYTEVEGAIADERCTTTPA